MIFFISKSTLESVNFQGCNLGGANFSGSFLKNVNFNNGDLRWTQLVNVNCDSTSFDKVAALESNFNYAVLNDLIMTESDFRRSTFVGSSIVNVNYSETNLAMSNFTNSKMSYVTFDNANTYGIILPAADEIKL